MTTERIVVGVDASTSAGRALRWAIAEARLRGVPVAAVHVWRYPVLTYSPAIVASPVFAHEDLEAEARAELDLAVDAALADETGPLPTVERVVVEGAAAPGLLKAAAEAAMLVVGHRGRGGFAGLVLGSVAQQCAAHAPCPVVVVR